MDSKIQKNLEAAKAHFYSLRLVEAYNILRRYYDRLPFQADPEHAEYIGMFARILAELGKEFELHFYLGALEKLRATTKNPVISFQLGMVYFYLKEPRYEAGKKIFEEILRDPKSSTYHAKSKMMLAQYYKTVHNDMGACRQLIDSIGETNDVGLVPLIEIWRGVILLEEKKFDEAESYFRKVLETETLESNWYAVFSAKANLALTAMDRGEPEKATLLVEEIQELFKGKSWKSLSKFMEVIRKQIAETSNPGPMTLKVIDGERILSYERKSLSLNSKLPSDKLLISLARKGYVDKAFIVKTLYSRTYESERDDKLIYYHIHSLRKRLGEMGVPSDAIRSEDGGYRLVSQVETFEEEL